MKKHSFTARFINDWNSLLNNIVMTTNTTSFKTFTDMIVDLEFCNV